MTIGPPLNSLRRSQSWISLVSQWAGKLLIFKRRFCPSGGVLPDDLPRDVAFWPVSTVHGNAAIRPVSGVKPTCRDRRSTDAIDPSATSMGDSDIGIYGILDGTPDRSALMPKAFTTLPHFSVSSAISFPKSAGESASTAPPRSEAMC